MDTGSIYAFMAILGTNEKRTKIHHNLTWDQFAGHMAYQHYSDYGVDKLDLYQNLYWSSSRSKRVDNVIQVLGPSNGRTKCSDIVVKKDIYDGGVEGLKDADYPGGKTFRTGPTIKDEEDTWFPYPWAM